MSENTISAVNRNSKAIKRTFWGAAAFYFLIAFEFLYMASPFAVYFYSVYRPALDFFNSSPVLAWLIRFFMPHAIPETRSTFINLHNIIGAVLAGLGFLGFCIGAVQVYYHKLARKGAVTGGIYNWIRHPQYACFIVCSFGLLILWPRYIVLIMFTTMLFVYYLLARAEERECEAKFGQSYIEYKNKTGMFLPFRLGKGFRLPELSRSRVGKAGFMLAVYLLTLTIAIGIALGINRLSLNNLYAIYTKNSANISASRMDTVKLQKVLDIAWQDKAVTAEIDRTGDRNRMKMLNYILPTTWYEAEIPMNSVHGARGHSAPSGYDRNAYKIIFTKAVIRQNRDVDGREILENVAEREPIVEVWVNVAEGKVTRILQMPKHIMYENTPVAVY